MCEDKKGRTERRWRETNLFGVLPGRDSPKCSRIPVPQDALSDISPHQTAIDLDQYLSCSLAPMAAPDTSSSSDSSSSATTPTTAPRVDIFKDTPIRFLGYANELGEACRPLIPRWLVNATYVVAVAYGSGDVYDKCTATWSSPIPSHVPASERHAFNRQRTLRIGVETGIWQLLASVAVPPLFINRMCALTRFTLERYQLMSPVARRVAATASGLMLIPFIVHPIDHSVSWFMQRTYTPMADRVWPLTAIELSQSPSDFLNHQTQHHNDNNDSKSNGNDEGSSTNK